MNMSEDEERELIDRARAGEAIAFEQLAEQHAARLWRCALALGKNGHWAEDLSQETLVEAWRSMARFDGRCQFSTWLYGILRHRFLKGRRHQNAARSAAPETLPTKVAGKLRRAVRSSRFVGILGSRHIECAYYLDFCRLCRWVKLQIAVSLSQSHVDLSQGRVTKPVVLFSWVR